MPKDALPITSSPAPELPNAQLQEYVSLNSEQCTYLLELIKDMDAGIAFTSQIRPVAYAHLFAVKTGLNSPLGESKLGKLTHNDVKYLLDLVEDDELASTREIKFQTLGALKKIQILMESAFNARLSPEEQRKLRRVRRTENATRLEQLERAFSERRIR